MGGMTMGEARRISGPLEGGWTKKQVQDGAKKAVFKGGRMLRRKMPHRWRRLAATQQGRIRGLQLGGLFLHVVPAQRAEEQEEDVPALLGTVSAAAAALEVERTEGKVGEAVAEMAAGEAGCRWGA